MGVRECLSAGSASKSHNPPFCEVIDEDIGICRGRCSPLRMEFSIEREHEGSGEAKPQSGGFRKRRPCRRSANFPLRTNLSHGWFKSCGEMSTGSFCRCLI